MCDIVGTNNQLGHNNLRQHREMETDRGLEAKIEEIEEHRKSPLGLIKAKTEDEFLVKIGAKEEEIIWDPKIVNEKVRRSSSFVCAQYNNPACYRTKPKLVTTSPWICESQAMRQLSLVARFGPKQFYINNPNIHNIGNNHLQGETTQALGLCFKPKTVSTW